MLLRASGLWNDGYTWFILDHFLTNTLLFIGLSDWNTSLQVDMSLHLQNFILTASQVVLAITI